MNNDPTFNLLDGKYELVERLGEGGMAEVWRAFSHGASGFRRPVAIKRIHPDYKGYPEVVAMFVEEARVGAALHHPNIVEVYDFRVDRQGEHYLVTELVLGPHLGQWVEAHVNHPTPWPVVTAVAVEVLRALEAAHSRRDESGKNAPVLHRDVTPPNILLDQSGVVKLADFGLARAMDRDQMTRPNVVKGKLSYLAPELALGGAPSIKSDLYSLGVVLWEALTRERLFEGQSDVEVLQKLSNPSIPLLNMKRPELPLRLTRVVHRALSRNPRARFQSATEMRKELVEVLRVHPMSVDAEAIASSVHDVMSGATSKKTQSS